LSVIRLSINKVSNTEITQA